MATASIQTPSSCDQDRLAFWVGAADLHGITLTDDHAALVGEADDLTLVRALFSHLGDPEQHELLWAAGQMAAQLADACV